MKRSKVSLPTKTKNLVSLLARRVGGFLTGYCAENIYRTVVRCALECHEAKL